MTISQNTPIHSSTCTAISSWKAPSSSLMPFATVSAYHSDRSSKRTGRNIMIDASAINSITTSPLNLTSVPKVCHLPTCCRTDGIQLHMLTVPAKQEPSSGSPTLLRQLPSRNAMRRLFKGEYKNDTSLSSWV